MIIIKEECILNEKEIQKNLMNYLRTQTLSALATLRNFYQYEESTGKDHSQELGMIKKIIENGEYKNEF